MRKLVGFVIVSAVSVTLGIAAMAQEITIRVGHTNAVDSIQDMGLQKLRELLEAKTNGKATIEIFANGQLGDERQLVEGVLLGTLDMAMVSNAITSNFVNDFRVLDMPFMFENIAVLSRKLEGPAKALTHKAANGSGFQLIGTYSSGIRHMMTSKPIASIDDLANMKIRTMQQPMHIDAFRAFGANPTPLAYAELYGALQSGVVDGAEGATSDYNAKKFYEVADHFSLVGWLNLLAQVFVSESMFAGLPSDVQAALLEAGTESAIWQRQYVIDQEQPLLAELRAKGVTVVEPDVSGFKAAAAPLYEGFIETDSQQELFDALNAVE